MFFTKFIWMKTIEKEPQEVGGNKINVVIDLFIIYKLEIK